MFANTVRGDVIIKGGTGDRHREVDRGGSAGRGARGKINVSSVNEKVRITNTSGDITAESINGGITMTGIDVEERGRVDA